MGVSTQHGLYVLGVQQLAMYTSHRRKPIQRTHGDFYQEGQLMLACSIHQQGIRVVRVTCMCESVEDGAAERKEDRPHRRDNGQDGQVEGREQGDDACSGKARRVRGEVHA